MASFDDAMKNAVPGGNLATPIAVAVGALILGKMFGGRFGARVHAVPRRSRRLGNPCRRMRRPAAFSAALRTSSASSARAGVAPQVNSWVGHGPNEPVQPGQLGSALGQNVLAELSQRTGMSQQELLNQLSTVLPQIINHLTPNGRMPTVADLER